MSKSVFTLDLSKAASKDLEAVIENAVKKESVIKKGYKAFVMDSYDGDSVFLGLIYEIINSKEACASIATVVIAWIKLKNGKKIVIKKDGVKIEASNLTQKELEAILEKGSELVIGEEKKAE
ncbi:hypothetical protein WMR32_005259 [Klebsiella oxytoca]|nr:hypothetical protein [Klebsiella oxytoca]HEJ8155955.1 hypothetical protein [Klebsiella oxytoca]